MKKYTLPIFIFFLSTQLIIHSMENDNTVDRNDNKVKLSNFENQSNRLKDAVEFFNDYKIIYPCLSNIHPIFCKFEEYAYDVLDNFPNTGNELLVGLYIHLSIEHIRTNKHTIINGLYMPCYILLKKAGVNLKDTSSAPTERF